MKLHSIDLLKELNPPQTEGVRPASQYKGVKVCGLLDISTDGVEHRSESVNLAARDIISVVSDETGGEDVLFGVLPLQVDV